jgi:hypothetical protein
MHINTHTNLFQTCVAAMMHSRPFTPLHSTTHHNHICRSTEDCNNNKRSIRPRKNCIGPLVTLERCQLLDNKRPNSLDASIRRTCSVSTDVLCC